MNQSDTKPVTHPDPPRNRVGAPILAGIGAAALGFAFLECTRPAWRWLSHVWLTNPDYSHGFLVPVFAGLLLWLRRDKDRDVREGVSPAAFVSGMALMIAAGALTGAGIYCRMLTLEAGAIPVYLAGIVLCCGGWRAAGIAWPSCLFLIFMIPLPREAGLLLGSSLQQIATAGSTYLMQTLGIPAVSEGNVIRLSRAELGIAEACSGIRMLMSFFAVTTAVCLIVDRSLWEKGILWLSAPAIAIAVNILRISATGMAYEYGDEKTAELIYHDLAGWLMMPAGLCFVGIELWLLSKIFPRADSYEETFILPRQRTASQLTAAELRT